MLIRRFWGEGGWAANSQQTDVEVESQMQVVQPQTLEQGLPQWLQTVTQLPTFRFPVGFATICNSRLSNFPRDRQERERDERERERETRVRERERERKRKRGKRERERKRERKNHLHGFLKDT